MSRLTFLTKYASEDRHYDVHKELDNNINSSMWMRRVEATEHINKALSDEYDNVRAVAASYGNLTKEQFDKAANDHSPAVRDSLKTNPRYSKFTS